MSLSQNLGSNTSFRAVRRRRMTHQLPTIIQARRERDDPRLEFAHFDRI